MKKELIFFTILIFFCFPFLRFHAYYMNPRDYMDDPDEEYEDAYDEGYEAGRDDGYESGYEDGFDDGYEEGHSVGYNWGMDDEDNNNAWYDIGYDDGYFDAKEGRPKATQPSTITVVTTAFTTSSIASVTEANDEAITSLNKNDVLVSRKKASSGVHRFFRNLADEFKEHPFRSFIGGAVALFLTFFWLCIFGILIKISIQAIYSKVQNKRQNIRKDNEE